MRYRAISIDVHGTLALPHPSVGAVYHAHAQRHGIACELAELEAGFLPAFRAVYRTWDIPYGRDQDDARVFWDAVIDATFAGRSTPALREELFAFFGTGRCWRPLPGTHELLEALRATGLPLYAASNFDARVRGILEDLGLTGFQRLVISAEVGAAKPDPAMLQLVCDDAGCEPTELLHIGDSEREDGGACAALGCDWLPVDRERGHDVEAVLSRVRG